MPTPATSWLGKLESPEDYNDDWWAFSGYDNLLQFERDACYLAQATILFAESEGSLAELGALAIDDTLVEHLLVIVQTKYFDEDKRQSFLNLGPLKRVRDRSHLCIIGSSDKSALPQDDYDLILESVPALLPPLQKTWVFDATNPTHKLLLLSDLVDLLIVSKDEELLQVCEFFRVHFSQKDLARSLKLLEFFRLLRIEQRGRELFYLRHGATGEPWVDYKNSSANPFDRTRFKLERSVQIQSDVRRNSILERVR